MDHSRFDELTRHLGGAPSRRAVVRLLSRLALGGMVGAAGIGAARAAGKLGGAECRAGTDCQSGICLPEVRCSCSRKIKCKQPRNGCKKATCILEQRRCRTTNLAQGSPCADADKDDNACTRDICDGNGNCIHPNKNDLTVCPAGVCQSGTCTACTRAGDLCDGPGQCCPHRGGQAGCQNGDGVCGLSIFKTCCSGVDGPCSSSCDCCGRAPCQNGTCACPDGTFRDCDGFGSCACCPSIRPNFCGGVCCPSGSCYSCILDNCRCWPF